MSMTEQQQHLSPLFPYEPLTHEQLLAMAALSNLVKPSDLSPLWLDLFTNQKDVFLVKFLTARKWHVDDAYKMVLASSAFRNERKLDVSPLFPSTIPTHGYDQAELEKFQGIGPRDTNQEVDKFAKLLTHCYAASWHKYDKEGRPVYIERTGKVNVKELVNRCRAMVPPGADIAQPCITNHLHSNEVGHMLLRFQNAKLNKHPPIAQVSAIMDCDGFSLSQVLGPAMDILKAQSHMDQAYYPEGLHKIYVANAPTSLSVAWSIVKGWLDPRVQKKVVFMKPHETREKLLEAFDAENLPAFLGGTCNCEGGCVADTDTSHDPNVEDCGLVMTHVIKIKHGCKEAVKYNATANTEVVWEFFVADKYDITLEAVFHPSALGSAAQPLPASTRATTGSHSFTPHGDGVIEFTFDNHYAWLHTKKVSFRVVGAHHQQPLA